MLLRLSHTTRSRWGQTQAWTTAIKLHASCTSRSPPHYCHFPHLHIQYQHTQTQTQTQRQSESQPPVNPQTPVYADHAFFHPSPSFSSSSNNSSRAATSYFTIEHARQMVTAALQERLAKAVLLGVSVLSLVCMIMYMFRDNVKTSTAEQVADVAKRSLADNQVQQQVNELSAEVVHRLLTDPTVLNTALQFTGRLLHEPSTQQALSNLLHSTLNDPATLQQAQAFSTALIHSLTQSESVQKMTADLCTQAIHQPQNKSALIQLFSSVLNDEQSQAELRKAGAASAHDVMNDEAVQQHMTTFMKQVLSDSSLQQTAGEALWAAVRYSIKPRWTQGHTHTTPTTKGKGTETHTDTTPIILIQADTSDTQTQGKKSTERAEEQPVGAEDSPDKSAAASSSDSSSAPPLTSLLSGPFSPSIDEEVRLRPTYSITTVEE